MKPDVSKLGSASEDEMDTEEEGPKSGRMAEDEERLDAAKSLIQAIKKGDAAAVIEAWDYLATVSES